MHSTPEIFISYAWGDTRETIVDHLYQSLTSKGYKVIRDKVHLRYKDNIKGFMKRIGEGKAIIVVLSDKYLKSKNCMFEALQIRAGGDTAERVFPIVLSDANIFDAIVRVRYRRYWDEKIAELNNSIKELTDMSYISSVNEELNLLSDIKRFIDEFMAIVSNMNVLTPELHGDSDFRELTVAIDALFSQGA